MTQPTDQTLERLATWEFELQTARGYIKALEYGLHAVIAEHQDPVALATLWAHVLPEVADQQASVKGGTPIYHSAFQQALAVMSEEIQGAADRHGS